MFTSPAILAYAERRIHVAGFGTFAPIRLLLLAWLGRVRRHFVSSVRAVGHRYAPAQAQAEVISSLARTCYSRS